MFVLNGSEASMRFGLWTALLLAFYGAACAPTNANKRRYRIDQGQLDPNAPGNSDNPASAPGSIDQGAGMPGTGNPGAMKPSAPPYRQGNKANIFEGAAFYIDSDFVKNLSLSAALLPKHKTRIESMKSWGGTGVWLDGRESITSRLKPVMESARKQSQSSSMSVVVPLVIYNLPNRDCYALASNGELLLNQDGLKLYKTQYIDPIVTIIQQYSDIRIAAILEPDSLPNAITNRGKTQIPGSEGCSDRVLQAYDEGIAYAIQKLALPNTAIYLDAAHSGWLGYTRESRQAMVAKFKDVAMKAGGLDLVRGLAVNVANYTPLDTHEALPLPPGAAQKNYFEPNMLKSEHQFASEMAQLMAEAGFSNPHMIIDTGRNGEVQSRSVWGNWCNIARARVGQKPQSSPRPQIDAYVWVKPPGESDGSSENAPANAAPADRNKKADPTCKYDAVSNIDPLDGAPVAGKWFLQHFENLVRQPGDTLNLGKVASP